MTCLVFSYLIHNCPITPGSKCTGTPKKRCDERICTNVKRVDVKDAAKSSKKSKRGKPKKGSDDDDSSDDDGNNAAEKPKPRIRLRLSSAKSPAAEQKKQGRKRKGTPQGSARKRSRRSPDSSDESEDEEQELFDVEQLQSDLDQLEGTFESARQNLTKNPWKLPSQLESSGFKEVAKITLTNTSK